MHRERLSNSLITPSIKEDILPRLALAQKDIGSIGYNANNQFATYRYVSIDKYYEKIRPILCRHGLLIIPDEKEANLSPDGKTLIVTFGINILSDSGSYWPDFIRRTVFLPYTGAQSSGSALSYVDKFALRTIFKIVTGENDEEAQSYSNDADSGDTVDRGQPAQIQYGYNGMPFRIFDAEKSISCSFSDIKEWGKALKEELTENIDLLENNKNEIERVKKSVQEDTNLTQRQKSNLVSAVDAILEMGEAE
jgi:hypothetical protein